MSNGKVYAQCRQCGQVCVLIKYYPGGSFANPAGQYQLEWMAEHINGGCPEGGFYETYLGDDVPLFDLKTDQSL